MILLFGGDDYYPRGGYADLIGVFTRESEARAHLDAHPVEWAQVVAVNDTWIQLIAEYGEDYDSHQYPRPRCWRDIDEPVLLEGELKTGNQ